MYKLYIFMNFVVFLQKTWQKSCSKVFKTHEN